MQRSDVYNTVNSFVLSVMHSMRRVMLV